MLKQQQNDWEIRLR